MKLGLLDTLVVVAYFAIVTGIGFAVARREKRTSHDYFLAGSTLPWYAVGLSIVASAISTEQFIGEVGFAYTYGMAVVNWEWLVFPALSILVFIFTPLYLRHRITTMPEFLERRFGLGSRTIFAILTVTSYAVVNLSLVLYSGGVALTSIFDVPFWTCVLALALVTGAYTVYGGLASVAWTDAFQCVLLLLGGLLVFVLGVKEVEGGWAAIVGTGDRAHLILPADHPQLPWTAMLVLALCTNVWYYCTNQFVNQRCLGAKDEWHAKMGIVFSGFLQVLLALAVSFPGLIAYALNPNLENPNEAYPYVVREVLPPFFRGLLLAALVSAIMSTISALVNSAATVFTMDIYQRFLHKDASQARLIATGRLAGVGIMLVALGCVPVVGLWEHIFAYCQEVWVLLAGPAVAVFLVGVLWKGASRTAATATMALSFPLMAVPFLQKAVPFLPGPFENILVLGGLVFVGSVAFMIGLSLATSGRRNRRGELIQWSPRAMSLRARGGAMALPWYQAVWFWWLLLGGIYAGIYVTFW